MSKRSLTVLGRGLRNHYTSRSLPNDTVERAKNNGATCLLLQNEIKNDVARFNRPRIKPVTNRHFQIPIRPGPEQREPLCGYATSKSLFIYVLIYLIFIYIYLSIYRLYMA